MDRIAPPVSSVIWDLTYACPLRCGYCYSESGRRESLHPTRAKVLAIAEAISKFKPGTVALSGGEPLLVDAVYDAARILRAGGCVVALYTSGWCLDGEAIKAAYGLFHRISVSIDGPNAAVHDRARGRSGSFDRAMAALQLLNDRRRTQTAQPETAIGIDVTITKDNLRLLIDICRNVVSRFDRVDYVNMGAAIPAGLASNARYAHERLLSPDELTTIRAPSLRGALNEELSRVPYFSISDNWFLMTDPDQEADRDYLHVEPNGGVRVMTSCEWTIGDIVETPITEILERIQYNRRAPFVAERLRGLSDYQSWARATREIDMWAANESNRLRIAARCGHPSSKG